MIKAVIFDMDGLLIDSEPLWREAEVEIFNRVGVPLTVRMAQQTMGLRTDEVVSYWHHRYPWKTPSLAAVTKEMDERVRELLRDSSIALPGALQAITVVEQAELPMAIASSSSLPLIRTAIRSLGIEHKMQAIQSAVHEPYGKPHPAVYIKTANKLGIAPELCLAFEDSPNGVLAAKAARMKCIAVPETTMRDNPVCHIADRVLSSLEEFDGALLAELRR